MTVDPSDSPSRPPLYQALGLLGGVLAASIILGLLTYSVAGAILSDGGPQKSSAVVPIRSTELISAPPRSAALAPPIASGFSRLLVVMLCDEEAVSDVFPDAVYFRHITLRPSTDRGVLSDMLSGAVTRFPSNAIVFQSRCVEAGIERGDFP